MFQNEIEIGFYYCDNPDAHTMESYMLEWRDSLLVQFPHFLACSTTADLQMIPMAGEKMLALLDSSLSCL